MSAPEETVQTFPIEELECADCGHELRCHDEDGEMPCLHHHDSELTGCDCAAFSYPTEEVR